MSFKYIIKEGVTGIRRAKLAATTSIVSLFIALLLLGVLSRVFYNVYTQALALKEIQIEVFLYDLDGRSTNDVKQFIEKEELVAEVNYISKDSAAVIASKDLGPDIKDLIDLNFFPASYRVTIDAVASPEEVEKLAKRLNDIKGVDEVKYNAVLLNVLDSNFSVFSLMGMAIGLLILLAAVILVYNTIRLTIYAKRDLIRAMKLVGATNRFIRSPFIIEGIIQGMIAAGLAILCVFAIFEFLIPLYMPNIGIIAWPFGRWYYLVGTMIILAVIMGWWGSRMASGRFISKTYISNR